MAATSAFTLIHATAEAGEIDVWQIKADDKNVDAIRAALKGGNLTLRRFLGRSQNLTHECPK